MPQVNIDGRWHELAPGRLGLLGQRFTVSLGDKKVLLVRFCEWPAGRLKKLPAASEPSVGLRRVSEEDRYDYRQSEQSQSSPALLVHQDVSEVKPFADAVHEAANHAPLDIWKLLGRG